MVICDLEAAVLGHVYLTYETWKTHSTDHVGEDRTYFARFRENRQGVVDALRNPDWVRKLQGRHGGVQYCFQAIVRMKFETPGGVTYEKSLPLVVRVNSESRVLTFYPARKIETEGQLVYP